MITKPTPSLFAEVRAAGVPFDASGADLYLPNTPTVRAILARHPAQARNAEPFTDRRTHQPMVDVPFAFDANPGELFDGSGTLGVWEHADTGRVLHAFDDEFLAMQCAVRLGSQVTPINVSH